MWQLSGQNHVTKGYGGFDIKQSQDYRSMIDSIILWGNQFILICFFMFKRYKYYHLPNGAVMRLSAIEYAEHLV